MTGPLWAALPDAWKRGKVKHIASVTLGKMLQSSDSGHDIFAPYLRAANIQPDGVLDLSDVSKMWFSPTELATLDLRVGDVVVVEGGQGGYGRAAFVSVALDGFGLQNSVNRLRPKGHADGRYLAYYLIALRASGFIRAYCNVVSMPHLTAEKLAAVPMPIPPLQAQRAIADYLDHETTQIDELIAEQQRLVELLRERRSALLDWIVVGLPGSPTPLRHLASMIAVGIVVQPSQWYVDDGVLALRGTNVRPERIELDDLVHLSEEGHRIHRKSQLECGDVVVVRTGQAGAAAVVPPELHGINAIDVLIVRPGPNVDGEFLAMILNAPATRDKSTQGVVGTIQGHLNVSALRALAIVAPSIERQRKAVGEWRAAASKIDTLIAEAERFIELARERRSALITAAVTGQIDVRNVA